MNISIDRILRDTIIALFAILILFPVAVFLFAGNYFYNVTINSQKHKPFLLGSAPAEKKGIGIENVENAQWRVKSYDGLYLKGDAYLLEQPSDKWAVLVHGYALDKTYMTGYAKEFAGNGFNVLTVDCRGHGESEGNYIGMGWDDRFDVISWINEIIKYYPESEITLFGVSMGASAVLNASGERLPTNVKCIVAQGGYSTLNELFSYQLDSLFGLPKFPLVNAGSLFCKIRAGYWFGDVNTLAQISKSVTPIMFIHGEEDTVIPGFMMEELYEAADCRKERLLINGAAHEETATADEDVYWDKVWEFIGEFISDIQGTVSGQPANKIAFVVNPWANEVSSL